MSTSIVRATYNGETPRDRLAEAEAILSDKNHGMQMSALMEKYDLSRATIERRINAALAARLNPTVDEYRHQQTVFLEETIAKWEQQVRTAEELIRTAMVSENMRALETGFRLRAEALNGMRWPTERLHRLNGIDAPVQANVTVTVNDATSQRIEQLLEEMPT